MVAWDSGGHFCNRCVYDSEMLTLSSSKRKIKMALYGGMGL